MSKSVNQIHDQQWAWRPNKYNNNGNLIIIIIITVTAAQAVRAPINAYIDRQWRQYTSMSTLTQNWRDTAADTKSRAQSRHCATAGPGVTDCVTASSWAVDQSAAEGPWTQADHLACKPSTASVDPAQVNANHLAKLQQKVWCLVFLFTVYNWEND